MDAKALDLLQHLKIALSAKQVERVKQYLTLLLTCADAGLFTAPCVRELLIIALQTFASLQRSLSLSDFSLRREINQALKLARYHRFSEIEKDFCQFQTILPSIEASDLSWSSDEKKEGYSVRDIIERSRTHPSVFWHHPYIKLLIQLLERQQTMEKKTPFQLWLDPILQAFLAALQDPQALFDLGTKIAMLTILRSIASRYDLNTILSQCDNIESGLGLLSATEASSALECQLPLIVLQLFQKEVWGKEEAQTVLSLIKTLSQACLQAKRELDNAYLLLEKGIFLADKFNLATHKVDLALLQGSLLSAFRHRNDAIQTLLPIDVQELLKHYFNVLPAAEAEDNNLEIRNELYQAITLLEKRFLYQTIQPWIAKRVSQAVESGLEAEVKKVYDHFQSLINSFVMYGLHELALACLIQLQLGLTSSMCEWHGKLLDEFHVLSTCLIGTSNPPMSFLPTIRGEWQGYHRQLASYRKILRRGINKPQQFSQSQQAFTENMQGFVAQILRECEMWLGKPPEPYCLLGLGSLSRKAMSPYSDLECVFLVSNARSANWEERATESACYFDALYTLFEFKMASLGELRGFRLDKEGHPRYEMRLRGTPQDVIRYSTPPRVNIDSEITYSLLQACFIYGNQTLWQEYQTEFLSALGQPLLIKDSSPWGILITKKFIKFHNRYMKDIFPITWTDEVAKEGINIKKRYVSPLFYLLADVCFHYQLFFIDPLIALDTLVSQKKLPAIWKNAYRQAVQWADRIRTRLHLHYGEQKDVALPVGEKEQKLIALNSIEQAYLRLIDWAIFRPMQQAFVRWEAGDEKAILDPLQNLLDSINSQEVMDQTDAINSLIATLVLAEADEQSWRQYYSLLSKPTIRSLFHTQLRQFPEAKWQVVETPYLDGSRDEEQQALKQWETQLACIVIRETHVNDPITRLRLAWIQADGTCQEGWLHPQLIQSLKSNKLLDKKNKLKLLEKQVNLPGRHLVVSLSIVIDGQSVALHLKFFPEMPGIEYAAGRFARLLVGWGAPYVQLARLTDGEKSYPVLLSQTIAGELLSDLLEKPDANQLHEKLDLRRYSQRVILSLLLNQEDAKPSNFIAVLNPQQRYELVCVDNDRSFFQAVLEEHNQIVPIVKDITYCFETMQKPLHSELCTDILFINAYQLLCKWLKDLEHFNNQLKQLFDESDIERLFPKTHVTTGLQSQFLQNLMANKEAIKESILPIVLREKMVVDLYVKLKRIQTYLRRHPQATGYQLLRHVEPYLSKYYGNLLTQYPWIDARFYHGFSKLYSDKKGIRGTAQTLKTTFATLQTFHGQPVDAKKFMERHKVSIQESREELVTAYNQQDKWESIYQQIQNKQIEGLADFLALPDNYLRSKIINQLDFSTLDAKFQQILWETVIGLEIPFQKLVIKNSHISETQFEAVLKLSPELRILLIDGCLNLGDNLIPCVAQYCPIIEKLILNRLPLKVVDNRKSLLRQLFAPLSGKTLTVFGELLYFALDNCNLLTELYLNVPSISHLEVTNCPQFTKGLLNTEKLKSLKLVHCPSLTHESLSKFAARLKQLKDFQVKECSKLIHADFYQAFPFLVSLDISVFTVVWIRHFTKILQDYQSLWLDDTKVSIIFNTIKNYFTQINKLKDCLLKELKEESIDVSITALLMLGKLGCIDEKVISKFKIMAKTASSPIKSVAAIVLLMLEQKDEQETGLSLAKIALSYQNEAIVQASAQVLMIHAPNMIIDLLCKRLEDSDIRKRQLSLMTLSQLSMPSPLVIASVQKQLEGDEILTQVAALYVLGSFEKLKQSVKEKETYFVALGKKPLRYVRILTELRRLNTHIANLFELLMKPYCCGSSSTIALSDALRSQLHDPDWKRRQFALLQVKDLGIDSKEVRTVLCEACQDSSFLVRQSAIEILGAFPDPDKAIVKLSTQALRDKDYEVREAAILALGQHDSVIDEMTLQTLMVMANNDVEPSVRKALASIFGNFSQSKPDVFDCLLRVIAMDQLGSFRILTEAKQTAMESVLRWISFNQLGQQLAMLSATLATQKLHDSLAISGSFWQPLAVSAIKKSREEIPLLKESKPINGSSLFPENFRYIESLRRYRQILWAYLVEEISTLSEMDVIHQLLLENTLPLNKMVVLESLEFMPIKLASQKKQLEEIRKNITLVQRLINMGGKPKQGFGTDSLPSLLSDMNLFLQQQLSECTDHIYRQRIQQTSDRVLVLAVALIIYRQEDKKWDEKTFFKKLTSEQVDKIKQKPLFDPQLAVINKGKMTLKKLWQKIGEFFNTHFVQSQLQAEEQTLAAYHQATKQRYQALLKSFKTQLNVLPDKHWKQQWLYNTTQPLARCGGKQGVLITTFFHLNKTLVNETLDSARWVCYEGLQGEISSLLGSTYFGNEKLLTKESTLCMDANYQQGSTGATSDGYGHFADLEVNRSIQQTAYRAVKLAVRYADLYTNAENFYEDLPRLFAHLGQAVKQSFLHPEEAGTASCILTKVFAHPLDKEQCIVVAGGVGDGMAFTWDPVSQRLDVLIKPRQYDRSLQFTPISITESLRGEMLQRALHPVSLDTLIIRVTDGAWQALPHYTREEVDTGAGKRYLEYTLEVSVLTPQLIAFAKQQPEANAHDYRNYFMQLVAQSVNEQKVFLLQQISVIREKIACFPNKSKALFQDFLAWIEQTDLNYHPIFLKFLTQINVAVEKVGTVPFTDFEQKLGKINLGDDIVLHVERVSQAMPIKDNGDTYAKIH